LDLTAYRFAGVTLAIVLFSTSTCELGSRGPDEKLDQRFAALIRISDDTREVPMAFPLIRLYTGDDGESHFEEGTLELPRLEGTAHRSRSWHATEVSFEESPAGSSLDWHRAPVRQYVITLSGTLEFETRLGETFTLAPGTVLLAEDTEGGGHRWRLTDDQPWRRVYVRLE